MATALVGCHTHFSLRPADLLFHVAGNDNAITQVTPSGIDHVAIYIGDDRVVEAIGRGVVVTSLDSLMHREGGFYMAGRVNKVDAKRSIDNAMIMLGRPYDHLFLSTNDAIYCSELVQLSFVDKKGRPLFETIPMSFHDSTGNVTPYWRQFYGKKGMDVPEGQPGTNPGEMSQRPQVRLFPLLK